MPAVPGSGCLRVNLGLETLMMVFGVDPHKQSHTAVGVDELGRKKAQDYNVAPTKPVYAVMDRPGGGGTGTGS